MPWLSRPLAPLLLLACLGLAAPAAARGGAVQDTVLQQILVRLDAELAGPDPVRAVPLIDAVAGATGRTPAQVRAHLRARLAALNPGTPAALGLRPESMAGWQARRFVRALAAGGDRILGDESDYLLGTSIGAAARQAHVPQDEAYAYARRLVAAAIVDTTTEWVPEPRVVVVSGWTEAYELGMTPLYVFFGTDETAAVQEAVRDIQRFIVPRVVRRLPASRGVRYAVRERDVTALVEPDYELRITVQGLRFTGSNADLRPCLDGQAELVEADTRQLAWDTVIDHCTEQHGSASTQQLGPFFDEIADLLAARLDEYFETPK